MQDVIQPRAQQGDAGVGKGKDRQDPEGDDIMQIVFELLERRALRRRRAAQRDKKGHHHPGQRRMHAGFQHRGPHDQADKQIGREAHDVFAVKDKQHRQQGRADKQGGQGKFAGIKQGDDDNRADVVNDRDRDQKHLEAGRHALAEQHEYAERKGDIGGGGYGPAPDRHRVAPVDQRIDHGRDDHAADRADGREGDVVDVG